MTQGAGGESPDEKVRRLTGSLAADQVKRTANRTMRQNCERDGVKYARVPTGAETCGFCIMLASRGFVYSTAKAAGELNHYHRSCDCKVVAGFDGVTEIEGYDPDAYYTLWRECERLKESGIPGKQRDAILAAMRDKLIPQHSLAPVKLAELYDAGIRSAWSQFKELGKTQSSYQATVGAYLENIGNVVGGKFSAAFMAQPNGDEIWGAIRLSSKYGSVVFRYADYASSSPDFLLGGALAELKTPRSRRKVTNRLASIGSQFDPYPDARRIGVVSNLYINSDDAYVIEVAQRFVDDGTLDEVIVIRSDGSLVHLR